MYSNNGDRFEGDYKNGKYEGKGIYYFNNGDRYEGDYKNDKAEGNGIYYSKDGVAASSSFSSFMDISSR